MMATPERARLLRLTLQANAWFSGLSGLLFVFAAMPISSFLGVGPPWTLAALGVGLVFYALWLVACVLGGPIESRCVRIAIALDAAWVIGSGVILATNVLPLTLPGKWAVGIVADLVATFAALQFYGLHMQQAGTIPHETC